ncbi:hypothetical protein GCM10022232_02280 [Streptomyces plumbiresistens]|uniref:Uncharacterized protein n=2 Tax=Streptomyces plumbiresistens TaxID=511811 RepID=A0ABP7Q0N7_9ACTN
MRVQAKDHFNGAVTMAPMDPVRIIAGRASLDDVMAELCRHRPVFHSEADLQHSFAKVLWELAPDVHSRLEVPQRGLGRTEYLDLQCLGPGGRTAIEFKYFTRGWMGEAGTPVEDFILKAHGATDLARLHFVRDIARLERFCRRPDQNGLALMLTNEASLWTPPGRARRRTRDHDFRIHHGRELSGRLLWAEGTYEPNTCSLRGMYPLKWETYSEQGGAGGEFRYLAVFVDSSTSGADDATGE